MFDLNIWLILGVIVWHLEGIHAATKEQWRTRSIYQVFTDRFSHVESSLTSGACSAGFQGYCGGSWRGIIDKLDYIQGMGFTAIWISPIVAQVMDAERGYTGYAASDLNALNSNFGSRDDLVALADALHSRDMYLMVDIVVNHMGWDGMSSSINYSSFHPFNDRKFFHDACWINDYHNQTQVEKCWLGTVNHPLPDLETERTDVRDMFKDWIRYLVTSYSIDGLRLDTVKHVEKEFWPGFADASGIFNMGEVANGNVEFVCPYQEYIDGLLDYPSFYQATLFFSNTSSSSENFIKEVQHLENNCADTSLLASFSENHDQPRFASLNSDLILAKNILTYTMLGGGIPIVYQGQESHFASAMDPYNREALWLPNNTLSPVPYSSPYSTKSPLYTLIKTLNIARKLAFNHSSVYAASPSSVFFSDPHNIVFRKGIGSFLTLIVLNNLGRGASKRTLAIVNTELPSGLKLINMFSCQLVTVDQRGGLEIQVPDGEPAVFLPYDLRKEISCDKISSAISNVSAAPNALILLVLLSFCIFYC